MRTLFPSRTRATHERLNEANLPHSCVVEVFTPGGSDGEGGTLPGDWEAVGAPVRCRVSPIGTAVERVQAEQVTEFARYLVVFPRATAIPLAARLRVVIGAETLVLNPHGSNGPRSFEAQRAYECSVWRGQ